MPTVVKAVEDSTRLRANRATGWPVTAWFSRLKPDPLKRLHLNLGAAGKELTGASRTSVPQATPSSGRGSTPRCAPSPTRSARPWRRPGRTPYVRLRSPGCPTSATGSTRPCPPPTSAPTKIPVWAGLVRVLQYVLIISALVGAGWLALLAFGSYARLPEPPTPEVWDFPVPTLLLLGGVGLGLLLALVCRWLVSLTARSRARKADKRLRDAISEVSQEMVVAPIQAELASYGEVRDGLAVALR